MGPPTSILLYVLLQYIRFVPSVISAAAVTGKTRLVGEEADSPIHLPRAPAKGARQDLPGRHGKPAAGARQQLAWPLPPPPNPLPPCPHGCKRRDGRCSAPALRGLRPDPGRGQRPPDRTHTATACRGAAAAHPSRTPRTPLHPTRTPLHATHPSDPSHPSQPARRPATAVTRPAPSAPLTRAT